jgi:CRP-like cAMP-binding protein
MLTYEHLATNSEKARPKRRPVLLQAGTTIFDPQHPPHRVYLVEGGTVQLAGNSDVILDHLSAGDFFGEQVLLSGTRPTQVATALSPVRILSMGKRELLDRVQSDRQFASELLKNLATRIDRNERSIREFATEPVARRLAFVLFRLLPNRPTSGWVRLAWNPTNPEMALRIGTTRWRVSRLMNQFRRLGWLRREDGLWVNREGLVTFLHTTRSEA